MFTSRRLGGTPTTSTPYSRICPSVGSSKPPIIRSVVVLPQPDGPSSEKNSPSPMVRSTRSTAVTVPRREWNRFAIPTSSIAAAALRCRDCAALVSMCLLASGPTTVREILTREATAGQGNPKLNLRQTTDSLASSVANT